MDTVLDLVEGLADHPPDRPALAAGDRTTTYDDLARRARQIGNLLRYEGVPTGGVVGIAADRSPQAAVTLLGAGLLGATVRFDPPTEADLDALVLPAHAEGSADDVADPGCTVLVYGAEPADPAHRHWEGGVWSENAAFPPVDRSPADRWFWGDDRERTQKAMLDGAVATADRLSLSGGDRVAVEPPLSDAGTVAAGVLAPLTAGAVAVLDGGDPADAYVTNASPAPARSVAPGDVLAG